MEIKGSRLFPSPFCGGGLKWGYSLPFTPILPFPLQGERKRLFAFLYVGKDETILNRFLNEAEILLRIDF